MPSSRPHTAIVAFASRRPWLVLSLASIILAIAIASLSRVRIDSTLSGILGGDDPAAEAIARITDDFHTAEDLLVLVSAPATATETEAERLLVGYAARFVAAGQEPDASAAGVTGVRYTPDDSFETYFRQVALPAGTLWLEEASYQALLDRLHPDQVREQLRQNTALLAAPGPGAGALAKQLLEDPLRLREFFLSTFSPDAGPRPSAEFSDDRRAILIRVSGAKPVNDIEFSKRFTSAVTDIAERVNTESLNVRIGGGYAVAAITATAIRSDAITSTVGSGVLITLFLIAAYRRVLAPVTIALSAGIGVVGAFGVYALLADSLTPLSAVLGAMLAGLGVDYAIHFRSHHDQATRTGLPSHQASLETASTLAPTLVAACVTSLLGFGTIAMSQIRMLQHFAVLGCLGLVGALLSVWLVLPALLALRPRRGSAPADGDAARPVRAASSVASFAFDHPRSSFAAGAAIVGAAVLCIATTRGFAPPFETDPTVLHPEPNSAIETGRVIRARYRDLGETLFVHVVGDSPTELVERSHEVARRLASPEARRAGVYGTLGLSMLVPDPRLAAQRARDLQALDVEAIVAGVVNQYHDSEFNAEAFAGSTEFLRRILTTTDAPELSDVLLYPEIARLFLPAATVDDPSVHPRQALLLVRATNEASERDMRAGMIEQVRSLLQDTPGATLTGMTVISHDLELTARRDLTRFGLISVTLVVLWLYLLLRQLVAVLLAMIPVLVAFLCIFGAMSALGQRLNPVNVVAFPLLAGIAVDSGIFLVSTAKRAAGDSVDARHAFSPTIHAITCTSMTTALGFGMLIWTHTPAVRSLGLAMLVGVAGSLAACLLVLLPLLVWCNGRMRRLIA